MVALDLRRLRLLRELEERGTLNAVAVALDYSPSAVSQQLARLRLEGMVASRRDGKTVLYRLADERSRRMIGLLYELFCEGGAGRAMP